MVFDIFFEDFLADIASRTDEVTIGPKGVFLPETLFEIGRMQFPDVVGGITFHQLDDIGQGFFGVGFDHVVDMVFVSFHVSDENVVLVADFLGEAFDIRGNTWGSQKFFAVFANKNHVVLKQIFTAVIAVPRIICHRITFL